MSAEHTATDLLKIVRRVGEYLSEASPWSPSEHDSDADLVELHTALVGFSAPRDQTPDRGLAGILRDLCQDVDGALHDRMQKDKVDIDGFHLERKGPSYSNTWDLPRAVEEVAIAALVDENGEIKHDSPLEASNTVANAILQCAGISYMRVTEGDKLGVDLRKFRERGECTSPAGVIIRGPRADPAVPAGQSDPLLGDTTDTKGRKPGAPVLGST